MFLTATFASVEMVAARSRSSQVGSWNQTGRCSFTRWSAERLSRRKPVDRHIVPHYRNAAAFRGDHCARRDQLQRETVLPLGVALIIIPLAPLGLWWAIVSAVWPLTSALLE